MLRSVNQLLVLRLLTANRTPAPWLARQAARHRRLRFELEWVHELGQGAGRDVWHKGRHNKPRKLHPLDLDWVEFDWEETP